MWAAVLPLAALLAAVAGTVPASAARTGGFRPAPCPPDVFPADARVDCGYVVVPERRDRPGGRRIEVAAAVLRAPSPRPGADPIVFLDGGPSFGAISPFAVDSYFGGASYARDRDVVLVDTRGTGLSRPRLGCPEFDRAFESMFYSRPYVASSVVADNLRAVRACRDRLTAAGIDLTAYHSEESAADLEALRRALGYRKWNLFALSADGVLGMTYLRLYPEAIRSVVVDSGLSPQHLWQVDYYRGLQQLLDRVFAGCAANAACAAAYPDIERRFDDLVRRLNVRPAIVPIPDFEPRPVTVRVDGAEFFLGTVFGIYPGDLNFPETIRVLLSDIWRAAHGELAEVNRAWYGTGPAERDNNSILAEGKTMSYVCRESVAFITREDLRRAAREVPAIGPAFLDPDFDLEPGWLPISPAGCRHWPVRPADPAQHLPVRSAVPTLVLAGEYDTAVPPLIVRQIPPTLSRSYYYEFPAAPHIQLATFNPVSACARTITAQFLRAPTRRPDARCMRELPAFDFTPEAALGARHAGTAAVTPAWCSAVRRWPERSRNHATPGPRQGCTA
jgi:pimeloyl-ACP methyl ester carboxylesterase